MLIVKENASKFNKNEKKIDKYQLSNFSFLDGFKTCIIEGEKSPEVCGNSRHVEDRELKPEQQWR